MIIVKKNHRFSFCLFQPLWHHKVGWDKDVNKHGIVTVLCVGLGGYELSKFNINSDHCETSKGSHCPLWWATRDKPKTDNMRDILLGNLNMWMAPSWPAEVLLLQCNSKKKTPSVISGLSYSQIPNFILYSAPEFTQILMSIKIKTLQVSQQQTIC